MINTVSRSHVHLVWQAFSRSGANPTANIAAVPPDCKDAHGSSPYGHAVCLEQGISEGEAPQRGKAGGPQEWRREGSRPLQQSQAT